jgi:hypothetical protein
MASTKKGKAIGQDTQNLGASSSFIFERCGIGRGVLGSITLAHVIFYDFILKTQYLCNLNQETSGKHRGADRVFKRHPASADDSNT